MVERGGGVLGIEQDSSPVFFCHNGAIVLSQCSPPSLPDISRCPRPPRLKGQCIKIVIPVKAVEGNELERTVKDSFQVLVIIL